MAEGKDLKSNGLLGERGRRRCNSRLGVGRLLVHRLRHVGQDARPIHKRPPALSCPGDGVTARPKNCTGPPNEPLAEAA